MTVGDYDLRGQDYETQLVGPITDAIIDADRLARLEHRNGFPNFALYRLILAGDRAYLTVVRQWWVLFAIEWCRNNMRHGFDEDVAVHAAWDSLARVMEPRRDAHPSRSEVAASLGVDDESFNHATRTLQSILNAALMAYWLWLQVSYRVVKIREREV